MALANNNFILKDVRGQIGKQIVIKHYGERVVIAAYPDMPKRKATPLKAVYESRFKDAVKYGQSVLADKELSEAYEKRLKPGQRIYNLAVSDYLKRVKEEQGPKFYC